MRVFTACEDGAELRCAPLSKKRVAAAGLQHAGSIHYKKGQRWPGLFLAFPQGTQGTTGMAQHILLGRQGTTLLQHHGECLQHQHFSKDGISGRTVQGTTLLGHAGKQMGIRKAGQPAASIA